MVKRPEAKRAGIENKDARMRGGNADALGDGGFGFDQLFISKDLGRAFGESSTAEIDKVSHRGRALKKAKEILISEFI